MLKFTFKKEPTGESEKVSRKSEEEKTDEHFLMNIVFIPIKTSSDHLV